MNFVDATLAPLYGLPAPSGTTFQRVMNTTDQRQGFLGLAGFLTYTSRETRTSPIIRGKWILDAVWCLPLQLPANLVVNPLPRVRRRRPDDRAGADGRASRVTLHAPAATTSIDPIGLALEHFDGHRSLP